MSKYDRCVESVDLWPGGDRMGGDVAQGELRRAVRGEVGSHPFQVVGMGSFQADSNHFRVDDGPIASDRSDGLELANPR